MATNATFSVGSPSWLRCPTQMITSAPRSMLAWRERLGTRSWHANVAAFAIVVSGLLVVTLAQGSKPFYYDSGSYWALGSVFVKSGHFSLLNFDSSLRGYFLPLVDRGLHAIAAATSLRDSTLAKIFNVLIFASLAIALMPRLAKLTWPQYRWAPYRSVLAAALLAVLWGGYLAFPLSDAPAVAAALLALIAVAASRRLASMLVAGVACGLAIDMRPAYVLLPVAMMVIIVPSWWRDRHTPLRRHVRRVLCLGAMLAGFVIVSAPQALATHHNFGNWSIIPGSQAHLSDLQYNLGLELQLYNTYVGTGQPGPQMNYIDPGGQLILRQHGEVTSTAQYVVLVVTHPLTTFVLYTRHLINGLDQRYNTPYVEHVAPDILLRILSLACVFLTVVRLSWPAARRCLGPTNWRYPAALLLVALPAIPSAMEPRFMLPAALLTYMFVLSPGWSSTLRSLTSSPHRLRLWVTLALCLAAFIVLVVYVAAGATRHLQIVA